MFLCCSVCSALCVVNHTNNDSLLRAGNLKYFHPKINVFACCLPAAHVSDKCDNLSVGVYTVGWPTRNNICIFSAICFLRNKYFTGENHFASFGNNHDHRDSSSSDWNFFFYFRREKIFKKYKCAIKKMFMNKHEWPEMMAARWPCILRRNAPFTEPFGTQINK